MKAATYGVGRIASTRYCAVRFTKVSGTFSPVAFYGFDNARMQAPIYPLGEAGANTQVWVIPFPFVDYKHQWLEVQDADGNCIWHKDFSPRSFNFENSITCRINKRLTQQMHLIELQYRDKSAFIEPIGVYPYDDLYDVARIRVSYPEGIRDVSLVPTDVLTNARSNETHVLECGLGDDHRWHITLSYRLRKDEGGLVFAAPGGEGYLPWVFLMTPEYRSEMVQGFAALSCDAAGDTRYPAWFLSHRVTPGQLDNQKRNHLPKEPLFSIVVPIFKPPMSYLRECIESVQAQSYEQWELIAVNANIEDTAVGSYLAEVSQKDPRVKVVGLDGNRGIVGNTNAGIEASSGEWIAFLDQDDTIEPDTLYEFARFACEHADVGLLYCDEDSFTEGLETVFYPRFKPDYNPDALFSHNYIIHMLTVRRDVLTQIGPSAPDVEGAQDYDLTLRASEVTSVGHIPRVLYHWRKHAKSINFDTNEAKPYVTNAAIRALSSHFDRAGVKAQVTEGTRPGTHKVIYDPPAGNPLVSVIIPTKDHAEMLDECVSSLLERAGWERLEILLVENNSVEEATFAYYDTLLARDKRIRLLRYEGTFNYSRIINWAAAQAQGDYLLLLNNDTKALSDDCIRTMLGYFQRQEVGVVAPLLLFPDGLVQTAGLALMSDYRLGFINQNLTLATHGGYLASLECPRNYSAVLGAAQMVPRSLFNQLGGYDEQLAVTYNDVDFCWRVLKTGRVVTYTPHACFSHREFATRGHDSIDPERAAQTEAEAKLMRNRWSSYFEQRDPELNPQCSSMSPWFKLPDGE